MSKNGFDDLMSQLSSAAEQQREAEVVQQARLRQRQRIIAVTITGCTFLLIGAAMFYFRDDMRGLYSAITNPTNTISTANHNLASSDPRKAKLLKTVANARANAALVDGIMDNASEQDLKNPNYQSTNSAAHGTLIGVTNADQRVSMKDAMAMAKNRSAVIDNIMDNGRPATNAPPAQR